MKIAVMIDAEWKKSNPTRILFINKKYIVSFIVQFSGFNLKRNKLTLQNCVKFSVFELTNQVLKL
jgi:hypothetical protein